MAWHHNQRLSLHKDGERVPPTFLMKAIVIICWDGAAQHHQDSPTPIRHILQSWVPAILCASLCHLLSSHCTPQSVWALPAEVLALDQMWSVGLDLKPLEAHHSKSLSLAGCSVPSFYPVSASHTSSVSFIYIMTLVTSSASTKIGTNEVLCNLIEVCIVDLISKWDL